MTITLESIRAEHTRLGSLITAFEVQRKIVEYRIPDAIIELHAGERYAGIVLDDQGEPLHHLILLPGDNADASLAEQLAWAKRIGGDLPSRAEQALLFANCRGQFKSYAYWSNEVYQDDPACAWYQNFSSGIQSYTHKVIKLRARAVRRLPI